MGLAYGRDRLEPLLRAGGVRRLEDAGERAIAAIAKRAVEVGDLAELRSLSGAVALMEASRARCLTDLDAFLEGSGNADAPAASYIRAMRLLPEKRAAAHAVRPASRPAASHTGGRTASERQPQPARQPAQKRREGSER